MPHWVGGLPSDAPARPGTPAYDAWQAERAAGSRAALTSQTHRTLTRGGGLTLSRLSATARRAGLAGRILPPCVKAYASGLRPNRFDQLSPVRVPRVAASDSDRR